MKKSILLTILLAGAGISISNAQSTYGTYNGGYYAPASPAPVYAQPYYGHQDLHRDLRQDRQQLDYEIRQARVALKQELQHDKAHGVPEWQRKIKRQSAKDYLKDWRQSEERGLRRAHDVAHGG